MDASVAKLLLCTLGLLFLLKLVALRRENIHFEVNVFRWGLFLLAWPGVRPEAFRTRGPENLGASREFFRGYATLMTAAVAALALGFAWPTVGAAGSWLALAVLLAAIHLGFCRLLEATYRIFGWNVEPLFRQPWKSDGLADFWGRRWNLAFVDMNRTLFLPTARRWLSPGTATLAMFLLSGLLHEFAITFPAGGGYGGPTAYFLLNGVAVLFERRFLPNPTFLRKVIAWAFVLVPLPLLFPLAFREAFLAPPFAALHGVLGPELLSKALWIAGAGHFLVLAASFQVPKRLNWKEELARISAFNRKLLWTYGVYIVLSIVTFGVLTLVFHDRFLAAEPMAQALAIVITLFWGLRLGIDAFVFRHDEWPRGKAFVFGHAALTTLFVFLTLVYAITATG